MPTSITIGGVDGENKDGDYLWTYYSVPRVIRGSHMAVCRCHLSLLRNSLFLSLDSSYSDGGY